MQSTNYIIGFIIALTAIVAVALTGLREATKSQAALNEEIFNKRAVLSAVADYLPEGKQVNDLSDQEVVEIFNQQVEQVVLNMDGEVVEGMQAEEVNMAQQRKLPEPQRKLPLYIYNQNDKKFYIIAVRGNGLWDEIWGNIALESDLNTIAGASFDHQGETPGLGAEIKDNPSFAEQFKGKKIFDSGDYVSVKVMKGGAKDSEHQVDGISGATVTCDGVTEMMQRGIAYYLPYFNSIRRQGMLVQ